MYRTAFRFILAGENEFGLKLLFERHLYFGHSILYETRKNV